MATKYKTIRISAETYENLTKEGTVRDSFDDVIAYLLNEKYRNMRRDDKRG
jgi:predicted CopG family antitoxin